MAVGQQADDHHAQHHGVLDDVHLIRHDQIGAHRDIDLCHAGLRWSSGSCIAAVHRGGITPCEMGADALYPA